MFRRIVVPLDGSQRAEQAIPVAARLARASGGTIIFVDVVDVSSWSAAGAASLPQDIVDRHYEELRTYLTAITARAAPCGLQAGPGAKPQVRPPGCGWPARRRA
jgi:nucleotide-binding universal stress UspA family protein